MSLRSELMQLSAAERGWLKWFGKTGKLALGWACQVNSKRYPLMEQAFESIANTRIKILQQWVKRQWAQLEATRGQLNFTEDSFDAVLQKNWRIMAD